MTFKETLLAFACGVAAIVMVHSLFVDLDAQVVTDDVVDVCVNGEGVMRVIGAAAACSGGEQRLRLKQPEVERPCEKAREPDVAALRNRIAALESRSDEARSEKATAPFEVVNEAGIVVFSVVEPDGDLPALTKIFNETGARVATIAARTAGGEVSVSSAAPVTAGAGQNTSSGVETALAAWDEYADLTVNVNSDSRLQLGRRRGSGNYGLTTFGAAGKRIAGFGEAKDGSGTALLFDTSGAARMLLGTETPTGPGMVILYDASVKAVAALFAGGNGNSGILELKNNADTVMVEAGVLDTGIGVVRAGPGMFQHGKHFVGLPASYIEGKK